MLLVGRRLAIGLSGGYPIVSDLGEAAQAYGTQSKGAGWDIGGFASFVIGRFVEVSAGSELVTFSGAYDGDGTLANRQAITSTDSFPRAGGNSRGR